MYTIIPEYYWGVLFFNQVVARMRIDSNHWCAFDTIVTASLPKSKQISIMHVFVRIDFVVSIEKSENLPTKTCVEMIKVAHFLWVCSRSFVSIGVVMSKQKYQSKFVSKHTKQKNAWNNKGTKVSYLLGLVLVPIYRPIDNLLST